MNDPNFENEVVSTDEVHTDESTVAETPTKESAAPAVKKKSFFSKIPKPVLIGAVVVVLIVIALMIINRPVPVEKIDMKEDSVQLSVGASAFLTYDVYPSKATGHIPEWKSSNEKVATVDSGTVKAIASGKCTITVEIDGVEAKVEVFVMPDLKTIYSEHCSSLRGATVGSDGSYLSIDTNPSNIDNYSDSNALAAIITVTSELGLPDSLINSMSSTTALMGKQTETFEDLGIKVEWSYHPDNGLNVTYRIIQ